MKEVFVRLKQAGAEEKALVFSENRTILNYLYDLLQKAGYKATVAVSGGKDKALQVLKTKAQILLATDSFSKAHDAPFCSCVINYDVPWDVQKLERCISCCQTYGPKHDVLAVNFIDPTNRSDKRLSLF